ncbi:MAG: hypothetical protein ABI811_08925 [Acidobacteriota bacterium]
MTPLPKDLSSGWKTYEVCVRTGAKTAWPVMAALEASGSASTQALGKMQLVEVWGWPEAKRRMKDAQGKHLIVKKDDVIWLLKCKPHCWRLYFYVKEYAEENRIVYVHAVCKKQGPEDPQDAIKARRISDAIKPGGSGVTPVEFP